MPVFSDLFVPINPSIKVKVWSSQSSELAN